MADATNLLRRNTLEKKIGLGHSAIYDRLNPKSKYYDPDFPQPIKLGKGLNPPIAWLESDVERWIQIQIQNSRQAA